VKIRSKKLFPKLENGPTHPTVEAATRAFGQVESTTNGGEVLFVYPQQLNSCWSRLCDVEGRAFQTGRRFSRVLRVWNQSVKPRIMVYKAHTTVMYPVNFSQLRVEGITIAGTESKKVTKTKTAFPIAAVVLISSWQFGFSETTDRLVDIVGTTGLERWSEL
jgi:hypothetical protein